MNLVILGTTADDGIDPADIEENKAADQIDSSGSEIHTLGMAKQTSGMLQSLLFWVPHSRG